MTNIVYIMVDDLGFADLNPTFMPRSFALMEQLGTSLNFQTAEKCAPTRGALMTGIHPEKLDLTRAYPVQNYPGLDPSLTLLSERFQDAGYATGMFGKWHLGVTPEQGPWNQGFDYSIGHTHGQIFYFGLPDTEQIGIELYPNNIVGHSHNRAHDLLLNGTPIHTGEYATSLFEHAARTWIREQAAGDTPFFAYVPLNAPHSPFSAPSAYVDAYVDQFGITAQERALLDTYADDVLALHGSSRSALNEETLIKIDTFLYYAAVRAMDDAVANIYQELVDSGVADDTLFMFASDNGAREPYGDNGPLRGWKGSEYEGAHRVANFVIWPEEIAPGEAIDHNVWIGDLYPTFLSAAGIDYGTGLDGVDVTPALKGDIGFDRGIIFPHSRITAREIVVTVLQDDIKYINRLEVSRNPDDTLRSILSREEELYDLSIDLGETTNVVSDSSYAAQLQVLRAAYDGFGEGGLTGEAYFAAREINSFDTPLDPPDEWGSTFSSDDPRIIKYGTAGDDVFTGEPDADTFMGIAGDDTILAGNGDDTVFGGGGNDVLIGGGNADLLAGDAGSDILIGGDGMLQQGSGDTAVFAGNAADFEVSGGKDYAIVTSRADGSRDKLFGINILQFDDTSLQLGGGSALDGAGESDDFVTAERVALLYEAVLDRNGDIDLPGLNFYIDVVARDTLSDEFVAADLMTSPEFTAKFGAVDSLDNREFLERIYLNVLDRPSDSAGLQFYQDLLDSGQISRALALADIAISPENTQLSAEILMGLYENSTPQVDTATGIAIDWSFIG